MGNTPQFNINNKYYYYDLNTLCECTDKGKGHNMSQMWTA